QALSKQGEGFLSLESKNEPSHFDRFLQIYKEFEKHQGRKWQPSRPVATNPTAVWDPSEKSQSYISADRSREWAGLFNLRYRMLLRYLAHPFRLARIPRPDSPNLRAMVMHRVFGEMYNLKTISGILVRLPLGDHGRECAGPPFEI